MHNYRFYKMKCIHATQCMHDRVLKCILYSAILKQVTFIKSVTISSKTYIFILNKVPCKYYSAIIEEVPIGYIKEIKLLGIFIYFRRKQLFMSKH